MLTLTLTCRSKIIKWYYLLSIQNQHPGEQGTEHSTNVLDAPESASPAPVVVLVDCVGVLLRHLHVQLHITLPFCSVEFHFEFKQF